MAHDAAEIIDFEEHLADHYYTDELHKHLRMQCVVLAGD